MCAICGIINFTSGDPVDEVLIRRMTSVMSHRGPDDDGYLIDGRVGLGHRRLSIIDLTGGRQPIFNEDETAAIVFNGEIYNYRDLARELVSKGHAFRTRSDTETILHAYDEYGDDCVNHLRGMFGFAIWDSRKQRLLLARDRLGIKPVYYYRDSRMIAFASEIKALLEIPSIARHVDPESLDLYLSLRYVPGPRTMFRNIFCLQPGHILSVDSLGVHVRRYWDIDYDRRSEDSPQQSLEKFRELLAETVRLRLVAEVPLGVFLSGGLDSSAILATMAATRNEVGFQDRVKTFSIGYDGPGGEEANEFEYARLAASAFATDHHEYRLTAAEFEAFVPDLVWHLDQPLADPSCIPLYYISRLAREHISVVLSGEGADEILAGYGIYKRMATLDRIHRQVPGISRLAPWLARVTPSEVLRRYVRMSGRSLEHRYHGVCRGFTLEGKESLIGEDRARQSEVDMEEVFGGYFRSARNASPMNRMLYVDAKVWLPDDLLNKADRMTMANGLELRVPFLDHKLVEFAAALPDASKLEGGNGKGILRSAMRGVLPEAILKRPKKGFPVPLSSWLRGPMRRFARDNLLQANSACAGGYVDRQAVSRTVEEHETGRADRSQEIWTLLVLEFWHRQFIDNRVQRSRAA
jgi:asparagine synthase (glutamine-hydrolysing)